MKGETDTKTTLKALGIALKSTTLLEDAYQRLRGLPMIPLKTNMQLLVIDLDNLPTKPLPFKEVFIKWMLQANESRLINGEEPILSYELAKMCPLWKLIRMPIRSLTMSREKMIKPPKLQTVSKQQRPRGINSK